MVDKQLCVLCGVNEATKGKGDHLPPQNIYPRPRKPNIELNTVPACTPCNQAGSKDDEEFKLVIGLTTGEFRVEQSLVIESMAKTMGGNKKLARKLLKKAQHVWARNPAGLLIPMVGVSFDRSSYSRVIERIIKGLYWQQTGQIMPKRKVLVVHGDEPEGQLVSAIKRVLQMIDPVALNGGTFVYKVSFTDNNDESFWALQFFKKHTVFATVLPESVPAVS